MPNFVKDQGVTDSYFFLMTYPDSAEARSSPRMLKLGKIGLDDIVSVLGSWAAGWGDMDSLVLSRPGIRGTAMIEN